MMRRTIVAPGARAKTRLKGNWAGSARRIGAICEVQPHAIGTLHAGCLLPFATSKPQKLGIQSAQALPGYSAVARCFVDCIAVMLLRVVHITVLGIFSAAMALACAAAETAAVVIDGARGGQKSVSMRVGTTLAIDLAAVPGTGFRWIANEPLPPILALKGDETVGQAERPGQKGRQRLTFVVTGQGEGSLVLHYRRPWEPVTGKEELI